MVLDRISDIKYIPLYSIFLLFVTICGNFLSEILPCRFQKMIQTSMLIRYLFVFLTLFFLVLSISDSDILKNFIQTIIIFIWFCFLIRNSYPFFILNLFLLFFIYLLSIKELGLINEGKNIKKIEMVNNILIIICFFLTILGFFLNLWKRKKQFKHKFNFKRFFFGNSYCN